MTSQILNVVIVLAGIYIACGVICSFAQEQFAALLKLRSTTLQRGIKALVAGDVALYATVITHPLVHAAADGASEFPSYIDPRNYSLAFWQTLQAIASGSDGATLSAVTQPQAAMIALVADVNAWQPPNAPSARVKATAVALLTAAQGDYAKLLGATDEWFNAQMDRVSGWYKRSAQYAMIVIAVAIAFGAGIDSIDIGRQLFAAPAIAQATANVIAHAAATNADSGTGALAVTRAIADTQSLQDLHLFWHVGARGVAHAVAPSDPWQKIAGLLITAIAASLGAPFWFDLLKGIINVRMAGEKPVGTPPDATPSPST